LARTAADLGSDPNSAGHTRGASRPALARKPQTASLGRKLAVSPSQKFVMALIAGSAHPVWAGGLKGIKFGTRYSRFGVGSQFGTLSLLLPLAVGLVVAGPLLGHTSWHAYRGSVRWPVAARPSQ